MEQKANWRLIVTPPLSGAENMAIDEALLRSFDPGSSCPVFRIYSWEPATLSLGRFQKAADVLDMERCNRDGIPVVRRITGGGMICHADEMTYSIVCSPGQIPEASSVKDSFRVLTGFLLDFYRSLGLAAVYASNATPGGQFGGRTAFCFAGRESFDIVVNDRKIGGNAQRRLKNVIFQHGSIPLEDRSGRGLRYLRIPPSGLEQRVTSLRSEGVAVCLHTLQMLLAESFRRYFCTELSEELMTDTEAELAALLANGRYLSEQWNLEGMDD